MKNSKHPIDNLFKEEFAQFEATPKNSIWDNLENHLEPNAVDEAFKTSLSGNEIEPSPKVWEKVQEGLPLNLYIRTRLKWLSRVAAVLVILMALTVYFTRNINDVPTEMAVEQADSTPEQMAVEQSEIEETVAVVEAIAPEIKPLPKHKTPIKKIVNPLEEREFDIDEEKIKEILKPLEALPIDAAVAFNPAAESKKTNKHQGNNETVRAEEDTQIAVYPPLKVVEPHEVDELIDTYNKQNKAKDSNNN